MRASRTPLRIGWIGFHVEGLEPLRAVLEQGTPVAALLTLDPPMAARLSGAADYRPLCEQYGVPLHFVRNINDEQARALLRQLSLDVAFVIGWTQLVRREVLALARLGMIGAHASLLPRLRGRAPVNWALIRGLPETGNSLMWLHDEADRGDIIDQTVIPISPYDTCASIYDRVAESNTQMILRLIPRLLEGQRPGRPQPRCDEPDLPRRRPADGVIDWTRSSQEVYDFIRALTRPYPGAMSWLEYRQFRIWQAALLPGALAEGVAPGLVTGRVVSPRPDACGLAVACRHGSVLLLEVEDDVGRILTGPELSNQPWRGKRWCGHGGHA